MTSLIRSLTDLVVEPVDDVGADEGVLDGDLEPQPVSHLQPGVWSLHGAHDGAHPGVGVELVGRGGRCGCLVRHPAGPAAMRVVDCWRK